MQLLQRMLVAVDFDDSASHVLADARHLARHFGSEITLLHAIEPAEQGSTQSDSLRIAVQARLEQYRNALVGEGIAVPSVLAPWGRAFVEISAAADRIGANLIVLGASSTAQRASLGNTAEKVIRKSHKPVLATHPDCCTRFAHILCPVDFSDASARGLTHAIRLTRTFRGKLHVLTVLPPSTKYDWADPHWSLRVAEAEAHAAVASAAEFDAFLRRFDLCGVEWQREMVCGNPAEEIVRAARTGGSDVIVMGSVGRSGLPYLFLGSTAVKVARHLPCALLTVKRDAILTARLEQTIADINTAMHEGLELMSEGFCHEAIARFQQCLHIDPHFAHAHEALAEAFDRVGQPERAAECRRQAELIRQMLWDQETTAAVRASHPLFGRHRPLS
jgi:nucleotide-binding universal stress UspA family protein